MEDIGVRILLKMHQKVTMWSESKSARLPLAVVLHFNSYFSLVYTVLTLALALKKLCNSPYQNELQQALPVPLSSEYLNTVRSSEYFHLAFNVLVSSLHHIYQFSLSLPSWEDFILECMAMLMEQFRS